MSSDFKVYQGDCHEILPKILPKIENPIIVSDPPFNIGYHYASYKDRMKQDVYLDSMASIFSLCPSVIVHYPESLHQLSIKMGKAPERVVSWIYNSNTAKQHRDIGFYGVKPDFRKVIQPYKNLKDKRIQERIRNGHLGGRLYDWWNVNQVKNVSKDKTLHPCQMPISVMENIVGILPDTATIIDPFLGSGTTGVAAVLKGRNFIGIELDEEYCRIAENRIKSELIKKEKNWENGENVGDQEDHQPPFGGEQDESSVFRREDSRDSGEYHQGSLF